MSISAAHNPIKPKPKMSRHELFRAALESPKTFNCEVRSSWGRYGELQIYLQEIKKVQYL